MVIPRLVREPQRASLLSKARWLPWQRCFGILLRVPFLSFQQFPTWSRWARDVLSMLSQWPSDSPTRSDEISQGFTRNKPQKGVHLKCLTSSTGRSGLNASISSTVLRRACDKVRSPTQLGCPWHFLFPSRPRLHPTRLASVRTFATCISPFPAENTLKLSPHRLHLPSRWRSYEPQSWRSCLSPQPTECLHLSQRPMYRT